MTTATNTMFQYYLDNFFKFPTEIKNDIIYCQRALKAHIKVHQMVLEVFQTQDNADPVQKKRILNELETEIYEVNAEQHFLFLRLRRVIDHFYKLLKKDGIPMDLNVVNALVSKEVVPFINDESLPITPITVSFRNTEEKLIEKYFEVQKREQQDQQKNVYEIIDSDDEGKVIVAEKANPKIAVVAEVDLTDDSVTPSVTGFGGKTASGQSLAQMSLLKPIAQRMGGAGGPEESADAAQFPKMGLQPAEDKTHTSSAAASYNTIPPAVPTSFPPLSLDNETPSIELPVSKNVKMSRMNLRQALKRARTGNMVAKAAALANGVGICSAPAAPKGAALPRKTVSPPVPPFTEVEAAVPVVAPPAQPAPPAPPVKKSDVRTRATRGSVAAAVAAAAAAKAVELNSSSEDSNVEREPTPPQAFWPHEHEESRTQPEQYGQEMFLRLFHLFTPEMHIQMQQRRSKRKRRTVYSNERADFHYGRIEYGSFPPPEENKKKRKAFLLSPQVKHGLQPKRPKRGSADKHDEATPPPSRSSSSSPDEKRGCNECLKGGGFLDQCHSCKGYFHQSCHREQDEEKPNSTMKRASAQSKVKLCPACKRLQDQLLKKEAQQYKTLHSTAKDLENKMAKEKVRRASLQQEGSTYKIRMRNLLNILNAIKSDQENDSSE